MKHQSVSPRTLTTILLADERVEGVVSHGTLEPASRKYVQVSDVSADDLHLVDYSGRIWP